MCGSEDGGVVLLLLLVVVVVVVVLLMPLCRRCRPFIIMAWFHFELKTLVCLCVCGSVSCFVLMWCGACVCILFRFVCVDGRMNRRD